MTGKTVVLAVTSDWHCGSTLAMCPEKILLDDGGEYHASKAQTWLWNNWTAFWKRVEEVRRKEKAELYGIINGDVTDGDHHGTTQIMSGNPNAQAAVVNAAMKSVLALKPDRLFFVRGTEAHVGKSGCFEERIADGLRRDKWPVVGDPETRTASHWHLRMEVGGVLIDVAHHGRTGQREHTRASAAVLHAHDILLSHVKSKQRPPDLCFRAHYHKFNDSHDACPTRVITTGAWQLQTAFVHKVAADSLADIGGAIVVIKDGKYEVEKVKFQPDRPTVFKA